jgi:hypothetical protein
VYWYGSLLKVEAALQEGVPVENCPLGRALSGIVFSLHRPYELDNSDLAVFPIQEAVLCCAVPSVLLVPLPDIASKASKMLHGKTTSSTSEVSSPFLRLLPGNALMALRGSNFLAGGDKWYKGFVFLPPGRVVRAYRLEETVGTESDATDVLGEWHQLKDEPFVLNEPLALPSREDKTTSFSLYQSSMKTASIPQVGSFGSGFDGRAKNNGFTGKRVVHTPSTCINLVDHMTRIRAVCAKNGWEVLYHYTSPKLASLILKTGLRMSTQGQGDGGVYVSVRGPASYWLGTSEYEENIISDW